MICYIYFRYLTIVLKLNSEKMKKTLFYASVMIVLSSCVTRLGDLNMVSNRNVGNDLSKYVLLKRDGHSSWCFKRNDRLEASIDNFTEKYKGEYIQNAQILMGPFLGAIKVKGDIYGFAPDTTQTKHRR